MEGRDRVDEALLVDGLARRVALPRRFVATRLAYRPAIDWAVESDPAISNLITRDELDTPSSEWTAERAVVESDDIGSPLLSLRDHEGQRPHGSSRNFANSVWIPRRTARVTWFDEVARTHDGNMIGSPSLARETRTSGEEYLLERHLNFRISTRALVHVEPMTGLPAGPYPIRHSGDMTIRTTFRDTLPESEGKTRRFGRLLLGVFLILAGTSHLAWNRKAFLAQVPHWVPFNADAVVLISGVIEIALGLALVTLARQREFVGWTVAAFFVAIFPGNISQYTTHADSFGLNSDLSRGIRLLFQPLLVIWALWSSSAWTNRNSAQ